MFEKGLGISGVLYGSGKFEECGWGEHSTILQRLDKVNRNLKYSVVCLSSRQSKYSTCGNVHSGGCIIYENRIGLTSEQIKWLEEHKEYMGKDQRLIYDTYREVGFNVREEVAVTVE